MGDENDVRRFVEGEEVGWYALYEMSDLRPVGFWVILSDSECLCLRREQFATTYSVSSKEVGREMNDDENRTLRNGLSEVFLRSVDVFLRDASKGYGDVCVSLAHSHVRV